MTAADRAALLRYPHSSDPAGWVDVCDHLEHRPCQPQYWQHWKPERDQPGWFVALCGRCATAPDPVTRLVCRRCWYVRAEVGPQLWDGMRAAASAGRAGVRDG